MQSDYDVAETEHKLHEGQSWKWHSFVQKGERSAQVYAHCPETAALLESNPFLMLGVPFSYSFFSTLSPGTNIDPHTAVSNLRLRCHLPLYVPKEADVGMKLAGETLRWEEGKMVIFDDSFPHEVWYHDAPQGKQANNKVDDRVVLLMDLWHPEISRGERHAIEDMFAGMSPATQS